jgi:hypothetical protein
MKKRDTRVWSIDVVHNYSYGGWAVRRAGTSRVLKRFRYRAPAIAYALGIKSAYYVFVFTKSAGIQRVIRTRVKRALEEENWKS